MKCINVRVLGGQCREEESQWISSVSTVITHAHKNKQSTYETRVVNNVLSLMERKHWIFGISRVLEESAGWIGQRLRNDEFLLWIVRIVFTIDRSNLFALNRNENIGKNPISKANRWVARDTIEFYIGSESTCMLDSKSSSQTVVRIGLGDAVADRELC